MKLDEISSYFMSETVFLFLGTAFVVTSRINFSPQNIFLSTMTARNLTAKVVPHLQVFYYLKFWSHYLALLFFPFFVVLPPPPVKSY